MKIEKISGISSDISRVTALTAIGREKSIQRIARAEQRERELTRQRQQNYIKEITKKAKRLYDDGKGVYSSDGNVSFPDFKGILLDKMS